MVLAIRVCANASRTVPLLFEASQDGARSNAIIWHQSVSNLFAESTLANKPINSMTHFILTDLQLSSEPGVLTLLVSDLSGENLSSRNSSCMYRFHLKPCADPESFVRVCPFDNPIFL